MATNKDYGIPEFRLKLDLSQADIGELFFVGRTQVGNIESGKRRLSLGALNSYTHVWTLVLKADQSKALKSFTPTEDTSAFIEKLKVRNKVLREQIEVKQSALDEMKIASEANTRALTYLNYVIHYSETLTGSDRVWVRKQIKLKTQRLEKCGLEAQHTLLIGIARLKAELRENLGVV
jgi:transcriptional regulator with XRE-family HTH domain